MCCSALPSSVAFNLDLVEKYYKEYCADGEKRIGQVEGRPGEDFDEVDDVAQEDSIDEVSQSSRNEKCDGEIAQAVVTENVVLVGVKE